MIRRLALLLVAVAVFLAAASPAAACAVCYGDSDSPIARGVDLSILFMALLVYGLIVGGGIVFFLQMSRARRSAEASRSRDDERSVGGPTSSWASS